MEIRRGDAVRAGAVGLLGASVSLAWVGRPSFWYDEAATIAAADRDLTNLWPLLERRDLVHGLYYALMHGWQLLFGTSEVALRLPSVLATGVTCFLVCLLGQRLGGRRTAVVAGVVAAVLPGLSWIGTQARPYALATSLATSASLMLVIAVRSGRPRDWVLYAVAMAASTYVFLFAGLLLACHLVTVAMLRSRLGQWVLAATAVTVGVAPLAATALAQRGQIAWISVSPAEMTERALVNQYFTGLRPDDDHTLVMACGIALAVTSLLLALLAALPGSLGGSESRLLVVLAVPWAILPAVLLVAASALVLPVYVERYATFGAPAVALLVGHGVARLWEARGPRTAAATFAALVLLVAPSLVLQKGADAKGEDYRSAARFAVHGSHDGDRGVVLYDNADALGVPRAYPQPFEEVLQPNRQEDRPDDVLFGTVRRPEELDPGLVRGRTVVLYRIKRQPHLGLAGWLADQGCSRSPDEHVDRRLRVTRFNC
jgi:mannosyltransferase